MNKYELEINDINIKESILDNYVDNNKKLYSLIKLVNSINSNMTICIDGNWGCGKSFFVNQFMYLINHPDIYGDLKLSKEIVESLHCIKENNVVIYYDAWKNDNHPDAFESIIFNILNEFPKYQNIVTEFSNIKDILIGFSKNFINKASKEIIDFENIKTYEELASQIITVEEKKEKFKELIGKILNENRMILIIDELDRCNPLYASKILETIKHFYDLPNITIIVSVNNIELSNTIKQLYGINFDGYEYLNKFYDFVMTLDNSKNIEYSQKVLHFKTTTYLPHNVAYEMFKKYNFSYRECNRYRTMYDMVMNYIENDKNSIFDKMEYYAAFDIILPIIIAFKIKDIEAFQNCINNDLKSLRCALEYIKNDFEKNYTHKSWLKEFCSKENEDEIDGILQIYIKFKTNGMYSELFNDCIKMSI